MYFTSVSYDSAHALEHWIAIFYKLAGFFDNYTTNNDVSFILNRVFGNILQAAPLKTMFFFH